MEQATIFDLLYDKYVIRKPISLIEFFAGYGSQALALKYLGADYESHKIVEWAVKSIEAYNDLHTKDYTDYSKDLSKEQLVEFLFNKGISMDYSQPMTLKQIKSKSEEWCRKVYNDIIATHNLVDISRVHASDLEMRGGQDNIITYSFPCTDLSLAGKMKGMSKDSGTRSGLLWQVERILLECKDTGIMPNILIMENVPEVKGSNNIEDFTAWIRQLEKLGYSNYCKVLNAKNYGIPQNRNRCFMISILGEYNYSFPKHIKLKYKLKDLLEKDVPEKFYLSNKIINFYTQNSEIQKTKGNGFEFKPQLENNAEIGRAITTRAGGRMDDNFILTNKKVRETLEQNDISQIEDIAYIDGYNKKIKNDGISPTITTGVSFRNNDFIVIKDETIRLGGLFDNKNKTHPAGSIYSQNGTAPALDTVSGGYRMPLIKEETNLKQELCNKLIENNMVEEGDVIRHSYTTSRASGEMKDIRQNNMSPTLDTRCDCLGVVVKEQINPNNDLRIRKLTPKECWRLMGVLDKDSELVKQSDSSKYHLAGDSIVTTCLMAIFGELLGIDYKSKIEELVENIRQK